MLTSVENPLFTRCCGDFFYMSEYPAIYVGNVSDTTADVSKISAEGAYQKVKLTVDNIKMYSSIDWFSRVECNIVELQYLE